MNPRTNSRHAGGWATIAVALMAILSLMGVGCTNDAGTRWDDNSSPDPTVTDAADPAASTADEETHEPSIVASTTWIGALAKAAGANDVTVIAPADMQHQSDYDPKPSDLTVLADADFVLLGGFEGFADRLTQASGSDADVVEVEALNTPDSIHTEVRKLAEMFGTTDAAEEWISAFDGRIAELQKELADARPTPAPTVVAHTFMQPWVGFAGLELVGTFGPQPVTAAQLAELVSEGPDLIFDNAHVPSGSALDDLGATKVSIINFPSASLDLIEVFEQNTRSIIEAMARLEGDGAD